MLIKIKLGMDNFYTDQKQVDSYLCYQNTIWGGTVSILIKNKGGTVSFIIAQ